MKTRSLHCDAWGCKSMVEDSLDASIYGPPAGWITLSLQHGQLPITNMDLCPLHGAEICSILDLQGEPARAAGYKVAPEGGFCPRAAFLKRPVPELDTLAETRNALKDERAAIQTESGVGSEDDELRQRNQLVCDRWRHDIGPCLCAAEGQCGCVAGDDMPRDGSYVCAKCRMLMWFRMCRVCGEDHSDWSHYHASGPKNPDEQAAKEGGAALTPETLAPGVLRCFCGAPLPCPRHKPARDTYRELQVLLREPIVQKSGEDERNSARIPPARIPAKLKDPEDFATIREYQDYMTRVIKGEPTE